MALATGTEQGVQAMLVFRILYMIDVTGFFACLIALNRKGEPMETLPSLCGLAKERPGLALCLTGLSFSTMGIPPFSGFWGKFFVFKAAIAAGFWPVAVFGLVTSVIAAFYYLRMVKTMWFDPSPGQVDATPMDAGGVAAAAALFSFPVVLPALALLDPLAKLAASAFHIVGRSSGSIASMPPTPRPAAAPRPARRGPCGSPRPARPPASAGAAGRGGPSPATSRRPC